jgi:hypothetical protein
LNRLSGGNSLLPQLSGVTIIIRNAALGKPTHCKVVSDVASKKVVAVFFAARAALFRLIGGQGRDVAILISVGYITILCQQRRYLQGYGTQFFFRIMVSPFLCQFWYLHQGCL